MKEKRVQVRIHNSSGVFMFNPCVALIVFLDEKLNGSLECYSRNDEFEYISAVWLLEHTHKAATEEEKKEGNELIAELEAEWNAWELSRGRDIVHLFEKE